MFQYQKHFADLNLNSAKNIKFLSRGLDVENQCGKGYQYSHPFPAIFPNVEVK